MFLDVLTLRLSFHLSFHLSLLPLATSMPSCVRGQCSWCGQDSDDFSKHTSGSDKPVCDAGCAGSDDTCGGYDAMDVYQITSPLAETAAYEVT